MTFVVAGFGLGALNEAEDDDIDVYDAGVRREPRHMAFDEEEEESHVLLSGKKSGTPKLAADRVGA